jgi:hypothetical protein
VRLGILFDLIPFRFMSIAVEVVCSLTTIKRMLQAKQDDYNELLQKKKQLTVHS